MKTLASTLSLITLSVDFNRAPSMRAGHLLVLLPLVDFVSSTSLSVIYSMIKSPQAIRHTEAPSCKDSSSPFFERSSLYIC